MIALSCGIKISAVHHSDLSQSTRVTDRQTDRRTELRLPMQDRPHICSSGKNVLRMQHQPEACALDLGDDQSRYL